jgi:plasmid stabilization system protein ParE
MARVVVSSNADEDTDNIFAYLAARAGRSIAVKYINLFESLYERLADHPASGPHRPVLGQDIRIGVVSPYIVIYRHSQTDDTVTVLRIIHGRQDITRKLLARGG